MRTQLAHLAAKLSAALACLSLCTLPALADAGQPSPWQMGMQQMVTTNGQGVALFHTYLLWLITAISLFVLVLLVVCVVKFSESANPVPSRTTHNAMLEVAWTIVPVLILVVIAIPSFRLLREQLIEPKPDMTLKVTGHAWYWEYEYPADQNGGFRFDSNLAVEEAKDASAERPRMLAVDNEAVVPVGKVVRVQVTSADVIHNFNVPSFGFSLDAVPGRLNQMWFRAEREGVYYGQCRELCGQRHAYMPISIRVVSEAQYAAWLDEAKKKYAGSIAPVADRQLALR